MTAGALSRGVKGVVVSGRCRDLAEHREMNFPVFSSGHSTLGAAPFTRPSEIGVQLEIGAVRIEPGDWIVGDEDGVVSVPKEHIDRVVELAAKGREIDSKCMEGIKAGNGVQATFLKYRGK